MTETNKFTPSFRATRWLEIDNATFHAGDAIDIELSEATVDQLYPLGAIEIIVADDDDRAADDGGDADSATEDGNNADRAAVDGDAIAREEQPAAAKRAPAKPKRAAQA